MKLTGKCKEDFEKWFREQQVLKLDSSYTEVVFILLSDSMKYGVYVDWFDSVGINVNVGGKIGGSWNLLFLIEIYDSHREIVYDYKLFKTRQEARDKAIEKANEIRNEQL